MTPQQSRTAHVKPFVSPNSKAANARLMGDVAAARSTWRSLSTSRSSSRGGHVIIIFVLSVIPIDLSNELFTLTMMAAQVYCHGLHGCFLLEYFETAFYD